MKKIFALIILTPILALLFIAPNLFGMDQIILEYPELADFFASEEFRKQIEQCEILSQYRDPRKSNHIASFDVEVGVGVFRKKIVLNSYYINKDLLDAEEFEFVFCHELGHLHDKNLVKNIVIASLGYIGVMSGLTYFTIQSLLKNEWAELFKCIGISYGFYLLTKLLFMKFMRNGELAADEYSLLLTKNKDAAISALRKRQSFSKDTSYKLNFINYLRSLFASHPGESVRMANIEKIAI